MASKTDIARESKRLVNNPNARLQITQKLKGRGFNIYMTYDNEWFEDGADERTVGFIHEPLTVKEVNQWFRYFVKGTDGKYLKGYVG